MSKRIQSHRWLSLIHQVAKTCEDSGYSARENEITLNIMADIARALLDGKTLSDKRASALIKNIRIRLPHKGDFEWDGPIALTWKQIHDAEKNDRFTWMFAFKRMLADAETECRNAFQDALQICEGDEGQLSKLASYIAAFNSVESPTNQSVESTTKWAKNAHSVGV